MNPPENSSIQTEMPNSQPAHAVAFSSKFLVLLAIFIILIALALFIDNLKNDRSDMASAAPSRIYRNRNIASVVPASMQMDGSGEGSRVPTTGRSSVFTRKALLELRLFAPTIKPISLISPVKASPSKPSNVTAAPAINKTPTSVITNTYVNSPANSTIVNPLDLPVLKPVANPLELTHAAKNENPATAVVNILCSQTIGKTVKNISSSGVLISSSGLILTNAHVGMQPFLAAYGNAGWTCKIRSGSPAQTGHALSFIYIPSRWTARHRGETGGSISIDSGNSDFAILKASNPADILKFATPISVRNSSATNPLELFAVNNQTDSSLSFSPTLANSQSIRAIGYPIMNGDSNALLKKQENLTIRDLFGFSTDQGHDHDLIETSASSIGRSGSSGGAIVDANNYLIAIIANVIPTQDPNQAYIRAISLDHINASLLQQTGIRFNALINSDGMPLKQVFESRYLKSVKADLF